MRANLFPEKKTAFAPEVSGARAGIETFSPALSRSRLWFWGTRSALSVIDQGLLSGSSFLLNVALARALSKEGYGAFSVCFAVLLFVSGLHNVLVVEPTTVLGSSRYWNRLPEYFAGQLQVHLLVAVGLASLGMMAAVAEMLYQGGKPLLPATLALGIGLPLILLLFVVRRMCYVLQNPSLAAQASSLYCFTLMTGMLLLWRVGRLTSASAFLLMALGSLLASLFVMQRLSLSLRGLLAGGTVPLNELLRENWNYAHWLVLTSALSWMSVQMQAILTAGFLALPAAGALRAMQLPSLLMSQLIAATMLLLLPSMSQELGRGTSSRLHQKVVLVTAALTLFGIGFTAIVFLGSASLERLLFVGKYASVAWLMPLLCLAPVFTGLASGFSYALRALRKSKFEMLAYVVSAVVATGLALLLVPRWGLRGAAWSIVGGTAALAAAVVSCYLKWGRVEATPSVLAGGIAS
jgi:O-antigen/teichoic acid export membrane protein